MSAMFGIPSLQKLLVLALIVAVVWYGFKIVGRIKESRDKEAARGGRPAKSAAHARKEHVIEAEDMVVCSVCGAYVAAKGAAACGKPDCPY